MGEKILIAAKDPQTTKEFSELLKNDSIGAVEIEAPDALYLLEKVRELGPQLILLDVSLPAVSGYELCRSLKDSEFSNLPVILLSAWNEPFDERKMRLSGAESRFVVPVQNPALVAQAIVRYIQESRATLTRGRMTPETRIVLDLMTHRAAAILYSEIARSFAREPGFDIENMEPEKVVQLVPSRLKDLMTDTGFTMGLAARLLDALPCLLWVEICERLVEGLTCEVNGLGTFGKQIKELPITVNFISEGVLDNRRTPRTNFYAESDTLIALRASQNVLGRSLLQFADSEEKPEEFLGRSLAGIVNSVEEQPETTELDGAFQQRHVEHGRRRDRLTLRARAIAHATFYTYLVACGRALRADKVLEVKPLGEFRLEALSRELRYQGEPVKVVFAASPDFLALLGAHPMTLVANG